MESGASQFLTTAWTVVRGAQETGEGTNRKRCLDFLCRNYWKPIYYYIRRRGLRHDDTLDITQEYFATFLEKNFVAAVDRERGRFRTFVLVTVNRFLTKQIARRSRQETRSLNLPVGDDGAEEMTLPELSTGETAEDVFNQRWAMSLIESTLKRMKEECAGRKTKYYEAFRLFLDSAWGTQNASYREMAGELGVSEIDITNYLHRGRNIFHRLLRDEIRQSVATEWEIDDEIEALKEYLRR